jgi:asparagine synthase (glutamine-hydrolysing)
MLDDFAFVVVDGDNYMAARDPLEVKPLYYGLDEEEDLFRFRNEIYCRSSVKRFHISSRTFYTGKSGVCKYYRPEYEDYLNANQN